MVPTTKYSEIIDTKDLQVGMFAKLNGRWFWVASQPHRVTGRPYDWVAQMISRDDVRQHQAIWHDQVEVAKGDTVPGPFSSAALLRDARKLEEAAQGMLNRAGGMVRQARAIRRMTGA